ncbi:MAG TPA: hypothetical protein VH183_03730 [Burkholderiaceae bacterium]|jgi:hypothetical protein|nr:hypothetical protein [Burkholderiaceae bacterium]
MDATKAETNLRADAVDRQPRPPRKVHLDSSIYCLHSMRASGGVEHCDHDFNGLPDHVEDGHATWICLRCGRRVQYEEWRSTPQPG